MADILDQLVPIIGVIALFGMPVLIVGLVLHFNTKREEKFHNTLQELIRSGQDLSPELIKGIPGFKVTAGTREDKDIRGGAITLGVGVGLIAFGASMPDGPPIGIGFLVSSIGLAILAYGIYHKKNHQDNDS